MRPLRTQAGAPIMASRIRCTPGRRAVRRAGEVEQMRALGFVELQLVWREYVPPRRLTSGSL